MNVRTRLIVFLVIALGSASLPLRAAAEDVVLQPFPPPPDHDCIKWAHIEYNFETATFMTPFKRDDCGYGGDLQVTVTMTRKVYNRFLFQKDQQVTVTATAECPASRDCEFRVSMPHPNPEEAMYVMNWRFHGPDANPAWFALKWEATGCDSYLVFAECGAFGEYWMVRVPDR